MSRVFEYFFNITVGYHKLAFIIINILYLPLHKLKNEIKNAAD